MRNRKCFADVIAAHQFLIWATKIKLVTMAMKWCAGRSWVWGKSDRKIEKEGWESTRSASTAGPFAFFSLRTPSDAHSGLFRLPGGGRETPTDTKERSLLCCWEEGGRQSHVKRDASGVIMSSQPEKCRCVSQRVNSGVILVAVSLHCPF